MKRQRTEEEREDISVTSLMPSLQLSIVEHDVKECLTLLREQNRILGLILLEKDNQIKDKDATINQLGQTIAYLESLLQKSPSKDLQRLYIQ